MRQHTDGHLPAVVTTHSNEHNAHLANFLFRLELHLGLDRLDLTAVDNRSLVPNQTRRREAKSRNGERLCIYR